MAIPFDLWGQRGWASFDVVGESHYAMAIRGLLGGTVAAQGTEITLTARLVPEPANPYDPNAVAVWCGDSQVGYLPRAEAARYAPVLSTLAAQGWAPQVSARVWGAEWSDEGAGSFQGSVRLDLAEPHLLVPVNAPPGGDCRLLPVGHAIQVTGEEKHLDDLAPLLPPEGECWVYVTLHEVVEQLARTSRTIVEIRVDGHAVGQLSPKMSGELLPAIRHLAGRQVTAGARAIVKGNRIKAEVVLYAQRAHELPESWLDTCPRPEAAPAPERPPAGVHGPIPPRPTGIRFAVPPGWPQPPANWTPPPGWQPDPSWPVAPDGWQWWVPVWT